MPGAIGWDTGLSRNGVAVRLLAGRSRIRADLGLRPDEFDELADSVYESPRARPLYSWPALSIDLAGPDEYAPDSIDAYEADLADGHVETAWPPGRNDACWCGSGAKYKKCCLPRSRRR